MSWATFLKLSGSTGYYYNSPIFAWGRQMQSILRRFTIAFFICAVCQLTNAQEKTNEARDLFPINNGLPVVDGPFSFIQTGHTRELAFVGWSPDGKLLASYSAADGWIKVWNPQNGQLLWDINATTLSTDQPIKSPDGSLLATGARGVAHEIRDAGTGNIIWKIRAHSTSPERVRNAAAAKPTQWPSARTERGSSQATKTERQSYGI
jgi:WD40 repeat protein